MINLIKEPRKFFKSVEKESISITIKKVILPLIIFIILQSVLSTFVFKELFASFDIQPTNIFLSILSGLISVSLGLIIMTALLNLSLKILKSKYKFSQTIKILIYTTIASYVLSIIIQLIAAIIPHSIFKLAFSIVFMLALGIYIIALTAIGISQFYKIKVGRAVGAYFLSIGLIILFFIVLAIILAIFGVLIGLIFGALT